MYFKTHINIEKIPKFCKKIANLQKKFTMFFFIWGPLQLGKIPTFKDGRPCIYKLLGGYLEYKLF